MGSREGGLVGRGVAPVTYQVESIESFSQGWFITNGGDCA